MAKLFSQSIRNNPMFDPPVRPAIITLENGFYGAEGDDDVLKT